MPGGDVVADLRRQCAALPLTGMGTALRVVLVTSRETRRWVIPKGWIEPGEQPHRSAVREAFEEAGIVGDADPEPIGSFGYNKRKPGGVLLPCEVMVYRLRVARLLHDWPERRQRERRLVTPATAAGLVAEPELAALLRTIAAG
ncbi:NUDIX hydrolase [Roseomonas frigidaquae]|uniref:NUDIX hydrolase n=1 Tax=Falsiroseomonas frigidaquae TaxID=487318 RepID=A0ABX1F061_9PROT|nr:NUDIX hydrolase [Falsiroseomonas frigidaquae]NKE45715.1 NUDIX hydrolase [Falsiroseomonas frigidaquae]